MRAARCLDPEMLHHDKLLRSRIGIFLACFACLNPSILGLLFLRVILLFRGNEEIVEVVGGGASTIELRSARGAQNGRLDAPYHHHIDHIVVSLIATLAGVSGVALARLQFLSR